MINLLPHEEEVAQRAAARGTFFIYRSLFRREWRWKYVAANGNNIYRSSEGYRNRADCLLSIPRCSEVESAFREFIG